MTQTHESTTAPTAQEVSAIQGWATSLTDVEQRLGPYVARAASRPRAMIDLDGRLSPAERQHSWPLADICGEPTPYGVQYVLGRADGDADAVRDAGAPLSSHIWATPTGGWSSTKPDG